MIVLTPYEQQRVISALRDCSIQIEYLRDHMTPNEQDFTAPTSTSSIELATDARHIMGEFTKWPFDQ